MRNTFGSVAFAAVLTPTLLHQPFFNGPHPQVQRNLDQNAFFLDSLSEAEKAKVNPSVLSGDLNLSTMDADERDMFLGKITIEEYYCKALGYESLPFNFDPSDPDIEKTIRWRKSTGYKMQQVGVNVWNVLTSEKPKEETHAVLTTSQ